MAKLDRMPDTATIVAFRQVVDFYLWKGMPVARGWPRKSRFPPTAGERQTRVNFTAMVAYAGAVDEVQREAYKALMPEGIGVTWVDMQRAVAGGKPWMQTE